MHVVNMADPERWVYEETENKKIATSAVIGWVKLGSVNAQAIPAILHVVRQHPLVQGDPAWTCRIWTRGIVEDLREQHLVKRLRGLSWPDLEERAVNWGAEKRCQPPPSTGFPVSVYKPEF